MAFRRGIGGLGYSGFDTVGQEVDAGGMINWIRAQSGRIWLFSTALLVAMVVGASYGCWLISGKTLPFTSIGSTTIVNVLTLIATVVIGLLAYRISSEQYKLSNYTELFIISALRDSTAGLLVHNVSVFPIYLQKYSLSSRNVASISVDVGGCSIPNNPSSWYTVVIPQEMQRDGNFNLLIEYDTYYGMSYQARAVGKVEGNTWNVTSYKSEIVTK